MRVKRWIDEQNMRGEDMEELHPSPWFPCWRLKFDAPLESPKDSAIHLSEVQEVGLWCLLGAGSLGSERQLWATWSGVVDNQQNDRMKARSMEVEFIRLLAGTHNIDQAFRRVGLNEGDEEGWLAYIPDAEVGEGEDVHLPYLNWRDLNHEAERLAFSVNAVIQSMRPSMALLDAEKLGLEVNISKVDEASLLAHVANADSQS